LHVLLWVLCGHGGATPARHWARQRRGRLLLLPMLRATMQLPALLLLPRWLLRPLPGASLMLLLRRRRRLLGLGPALHWKARLKRPLPPLRLRPAILVAERPLLLLVQLLPAGTGVACCCSPPNLLWRLLLPPILVRLLLLSPALAAASIALPAAPFVLGGGWPL
jgi:hypothetical protein